MVGNLPDVVRDWELENTIIGDTCVTHTSYVSDHGKGVWRMPVEEKWEQMQKLGQGSFGVVWLQKCTSGPPDGQIRAVKEIRTTLGQSVEETKFMARELSAIVKFSHKRYRDCFVQTFGWYRDTAQSTIFIAMEYLPLGDLESCLAKPLSEDEARTITRQVLQGLTFMHEHKFAHRDIKPQNILVQQKRPSWWVKISDFGCSKQNESTALRTVIGTLAYLAPELQNIFSPSDLDLMETDTYSLAVDIWAVGVLTFRIVTGTLPFPLLRSSDLYRYVVLSEPLPNLNLLSIDCREFVRSTMAGSARNRPTATEALASAWVCTPSSTPAALTSTSSTAVDTATISQPSLDPTLATASWSTITGDGQAASRASVAFSTVSQDPPEPANAQEVKTSGTKVPANSPGCSPSTQDEEKSQDDGGGYKKMMYINWDGRDHSKDKTTKPKRPAFPRSRFPDRTQRPERARGLFEQPEVKKTIGFLKEVWDSGLIKPEDIGNVIAPQPRGGNSQEDPKS
ncbi:kinase-like domain-containing protein [Dactylonectria macrodidyma]|uniref:mitogen-activated protein kinase kinase n=1 Tax=Dactylonectria macrodidyma TaxID=307937 RepID=A0A9P9E0T4_9HYPO|nr:kinase-like domain-containing protein [Dactylonectria macrodidyma]